MKSDCLSFEFLDAYEFEFSGRIEFIPAYPYAYPNRMGVRHVS